MHSTSKHKVPTKPDYTTLGEKLLGYPIQIDKSSLQLKHVIAVGAFGVIFLATEYRQGKRTEKSYAVKCLLRNRYNPYADKFVRQETTNHSAVRHPNVVTVFRIAEHVDVVFIIMEYCPNGDLFKAIIDRQEFVGQDDKVRVAWLQIAEGVRACHAQGIYHRDIKPENILIRSTANPALHLVLADFGLSTKEEWSFEFGVGSSFYMSPECFRKQRRGHSKQHSYSSRLADIWALGVVLINLSCGRNPWLRAHPEEPTYASFCKDDDYLSYILPITSDLNDLLKRVFRINPSQRIALDEFIDEVRRMDRFTLNYEELMESSDAIKTAAGPLLQVRWEQEMLDTRQPIPLEDDGTGPEAVFPQASPQRPETSIQLLETPDLLRHGGTLGDPVYSQALEGEEGAEEDDDLDQDESYEDDDEEERELSPDAYIDLGGADLYQESRIGGDEMSDTRSVVSTIYTAWPPSTPSSPSNTAHSAKWHLLRSPCSPYIDSEEACPSPNPSPLITAPSVPSTPNCGLNTPAQEYLYEDCSTFPSLEHVSFADSALRSGLDCPGIVEERSCGTQSESIPHNTSPAKRRLREAGCSSDIERRHVRSRKMAQGVLQRFAPDASCWLEPFPI
ncbi:hypothetical protein FRC04_007771 [Tulasnella sp. 424]|nr:hypothetical protein FRC04_007771 [Tulasnella sp. 424]KAG8975247.1 hypothetical protein FRC05_006190 [Tulasnella sp. 425]